MINFNKKLLNIWAPVRESARLGLRHPEHISRLRNIYKGRRGFIVGNGPSLLMKDLDALTEEVSIASNKIYLAFPETAWRPNLYTCVDRNLWLNIDRKEIKEYIPKVYLSNKVFTPRDLGNRAIMWKVLNAQNAMASAITPWSDDIVTGIYAGFTVTYQNLQIAAYMGLNPIYIIGCDHNYNVAKNHQLRVKTRVTGDTGDYFSKDYMKPGEKMVIPDVEGMERFYQIAREAAEDRGIRIYNATRGGALEVFERADLDEVLAGKYQF